MDFANPMHYTGEEEDTLGRCGLARVNVGTDTDVSGSF
jgi:hypothetical protein